MAPTLQIAGFAVAILGILWLIILERDRIQALLDRFNRDDEEAVYDDLGPVQSGRKDHEW